MNQKVASSFRVASSNFIQQDDIETANLNIREDVDFRNGQRIVNGQQASQTIQLTVRNLNNVRSVISQLSQIDGINIDSVSYSLEDENLGQSQARRAAYRDAFQKGSQLAGLSNKRLGQVLSITDRRRNNVVPFFDQGGAQSRRSTGANGKVSVDANVEVIWSTA